MTSSTAYRYIMVQMIAAYHNVLRVLESVRYERLDAFPQPLLGEVIALLPALLSRS
jgi:hypothetical protein